MAASEEASDQRVLIQAHVAWDSMLVVASPDTFDVLQMIKPPARSISYRNARLAHIEEDVELLEQEADKKVILGKDELAKNMSRRVLKRCGMAS